MIELYHCARSRSFRPLWMLEELQLPYSLKLLPFPPRVLAKSYLAINPLGTVPCMIDGAVKMTESSAICQYVAEVHGAGRLSVRPDEAVYGRYLNFLSFGEATLTFPIAIYMRYSRLEPEARKLPQAAEDYRRFFLGRLRAVDAIVSEDEYICGDRFTAADISVGYAVQFAAMNGLQDEFPEAVTRYLARLRARPGYQRALLVESMAEKSTAEERESEARASVLSSAEPPGELVEKTINTMPKSLQKDPKQPPPAMAEELEEESLSGENQDRHFVTALARGLEVLSCFRTGDSFLANHEIAERCGLPKSTITRLTYTLTKLGYLHLVPETGKYRLGTATGALGSSMLANLDVRQVARPYMQQLAAETGSVVALVTRDRLSALYLECCRSTSIVTLNLDVGSRIPLGTSAAGRALLAAATPAERADLMERIKELDEMTWPVVERGIQESVTEYQSTGCVTSAGGWVKEVHGIAVPFLPGRGLPVMGISLAGAASYFPLSRLHEELRPRLLQTVQQILQSLCQSSAPIGPSAK